MVQQKTQLSEWAEFVPWFMTAVSLSVLLCLAWFLFENISWFKNSALSSNLASHEAYRIYVYQLHLSMIKRSVGLFAGFALIFVGTSVAFYTLKETIALSGTAVIGKANITTASPGIIAMLLGVVLIMFTIQSKDTFPAPPEEQRIDVSQPTKPLQ
jgi:hypothetical protein